MPKPLAKTSTHEQKKKLSLSENSTFTSLKINPEKIMIVKTIFKIR